MSKRTLISLEDLNDNTIHKIMGYLHRIDDLPSLAVTSRYWSSYIYQMDTLWQYKSVDMCLDPLCFGCGRTRIHFDTARMLLSNTNMKFARMHMPFERMNLFLNAVAKRNSVSHIHIRLMPSKPRLGVPAVGTTRRDAISSHSAWPVTRLEKIHSVRQFTFFSWPSGSSKSPICRPILECVGKHLKVLKFAESSPSDVFSSVSQFCPKLQHLTVEGPQYSHQLDSLRSSHLTYLCLRGTGIKIIQSLQLPNLQTFKYVNQRCSDRDRSPPSTTATLESTIRAIPKKLLELEIRVCSTLANRALVEIGQRLPRLRALRLLLGEDAKNPGNALHDSTWNGAGSDGDDNMMPVAQVVNNPYTSSVSDMLSAAGDDPDDTDEEDELLEHVGAATVPCDIRSSTIEQFVKSCPELEVLEISESLVGFEAAAFRTLVSKLTHLKRIKMIYDDEIVDQLRDILPLSLALEEIVFFENSSELAQLVPGHVGGTGSTGSAAVSDFHIRRWQSMERRLQTLAEKFPSVHLVLKDAWWP
mmetsp:Transcript_10980/g.17891  ORF Transcript_10980/g.17891 Transcript_10980/m.17891 type:complete len:528 (-) Transcript_10980:1191-2774(-)